MRFYMFDCHISGITFECLPQFGPRDDCGESCIGWNILSLLR